MHARQLEWRFSEGIRKPKFFACNAVAPHLKVFNVLQRGPALRLGGHMFYQFQQLLEVVCAKLKPTNKQERNEMCRTLSHLIAFLQFRSVLLCWAE